MTMMELRRCQLRQLEALKYIDKLCKDNHLTYYVHTGTLLGAAREGGYIPWDMDTDLLMPEEDCLRLLKLVDEDSQDDYSAKYAKDGYLMSDRIVMNKTKCFDPNNKELDSKVHIGITSLRHAHRYPLWLRLIMNKYALLLTNVIAYRYDAVTLNREKKGYLIKRMALSLESRCLSHLSDCQIREKIKRIAATDKHTGLVTVYNSFYGFAKETYAEDVFSETIQLRFEDMTVPAPKGYKSILTSLYGDWQTPPGDDDRYPRNLDILVYKEDE